MPVRGAEDLRPHHVVGGGFPEREEHERAGEHGEPARWQAALDRVDRGAQDPRRHPGPWQRRPPTPRTRPGTRAGAVGRNARSGGCACSCGGGTPGMTAANPADRRRARGTPRTCAYRRTARTTPSRSGTEHAGELRVRPRRASAPGRPQCLDRSPPGIEDATRPDHVVDEHEAAGRQA